MLEGQRRNEAVEAGRPACAVQMLVGLKLPQLQRRRQQRLQRHCCGASASAAAVALEGTCGTLDVEDQETAFLRGPAVLRRVYREASVAALRALAEAGCPGSAAVAEEVDGDR